MLRGVKKYLTKRANKSKFLQAELDFQFGSSLLEVHERIYNGEPVDSIMEEAELLDEKWGSKTLGEKISFCNDSITLQLSEMFQHIHDIDAGDIPFPAKVLRAPEGPTAADTPSIGPSTVTNPHMTLDMQMKLLSEDAESESLKQTRELLTVRCGHSLWLGPSQAPTDKNKAGVYMQGHVPPGTVLGLYPGAVFNSEMRQKAIDAGHLGNPEVQRTLLLRYDDTILDVHGAGPVKFNPYALAHHVRHPPPEIMPNCMRLQFDFIKPDDEQSGCLPFPGHLLDYVPNIWGTKVTAGQEIHGMIEGGIYAKGMVLIATRGILDEELFVDHRLNPYENLPAWYKPRDIEADRRLWSQIAE